MRVLKVWFCGPCVLMSLWAGFSLVGTGAEVVWRAPRTLVCKQTVGAVLRALHCVQFQTRVLLATLERVRGLGARQLRVADLGSGAVSPLPERLLWIHPEAASHGTSGQCRGAVEIRRTGPGAEGLWAGVSHLLEAGALC